MEYLIIVIVLVALALMAGGVMLLRSRHRPRAPEVPEAPPAATPPPGPARGEGDGTGQPGVLTPPETGAPATEVAEAPQPLAGRMSPLRGRPAPAQARCGLVLVSLP